MAVGCQNSNYSNMERYARENLASAYISQHIQVTSVVELIQKKFLLTFNLFWYIVKQLFTSLSLNISKFTSTLGVTINIHLNSLTLRLIIKYPITVILVHFYIRESTVLKYNVYND